MSADGGLLSFPFCFADNGPMLLGSDIGPCSDPFSRFLTGEDAELFADAPLPGSTAPFGGGLLFGNASGCGGTAPPPAAEVGTSCPLVVDESLGGSLTSNWATTYVPGPYAARPARRALSVHVGGGSDPSATGGFMPERADGGDASAAASEYNSAGSQAHLLTQRSLSSADAGDARPSRVAFSARPRSTGYGAPPQQQQQPPPPRYAGSASGSDQSSVPTPQVSAPARAQSLRSIAAALRQQQHWAAQEAQRGAPQQASGALNLRKGKVGRRPGPQAPRPVGPDGKAVVRRYASGRGGPWSHAELTALCDGVAAHGEGYWKAILEDPRFAPVLAARTNGDLKDKWRVHRRARGHGGSASPPNAPSAANDEGAGGEEEGGGYEEGEPGEGDDDLCAEGSEEGREEDFFGGPESLGLVPMPLPAAPAAAGPAAARHQPTPHGLLSLDGRRRFSSTSRWPHQDGAGAAAAAAAVGAGRRHPASPGTGKRGLHTVPSLSSFPNSPARLLGPGPRRPAGAPQFAPFGVFGAAAAAAPGGAMPSAGGPGSPSDAEIEAAALAAADAYGLEDPHHHDDDGFRPDGADACEPGSSEPPAADDEDDEDGAGAAAKRPKSGLAGVWSEEELTALCEGVAAHGEGRWRLIQTDPRFARALRHRTNADLKDKFRVFRRTRPDEAARVIHSGGAAGGSGRGAKAARRRGLRAGGSEEASEDSAPASLRGRATKRVAPRDGPAGTRSGGGGPQKRKRSVR